MNVLLNNISSKNDIDDVIFDHFSNHEIEIIQNHPYYRLILKRSPFLYCENFTKGLDLFRIKQKNALNYYSLDYQSIFSLLESWIPYGWSYFFCQRNEIPKNLTIIHLDDHSDLMSPFVSVNDINECNNWKDILTGHSINILKPESVKRSIESGAITLGSILTLLVYSVENINIIHLKQNSKTILQYIKKEIEIDPIIVPRQKRMSIKLLDDPPTDSRQYNKYFRTSDIKKLTTNIKDDSEVFLHIDMDFFNNRFNGSTDWKVNSNHDQDIDQQKSIIKSFCDAIAQSGLLNKIVHISIGLSPSFYPSEFWHSGLETLVYELKRNGFKIIPNINIKGAYAYG